MKTENIIVANLKCEGCAETIKNKISEMADIEFVEVDFDKNMVSITHQGTTSRGSFTDMLNSIGYPEIIIKNRV